MKNKHIATVIIILTFVVALYYDHVTSLSSKYELVNNWDNLSRYIKMEEGIAVEPAVLDYSVIPPYLVGLRLNSHRYKCANGLRMRLSKSPIYFVLNLNTADYEEYENRFDFEDKLIKIGATKVDGLLNYQWFDAVWDKSVRYNKFERRCVRINSHPSLQHNQ